MSRVNDLALAESETKEVKSGAWSKSCTCDNGNPGWSGSGNSLEDFLFFDIHYCNGTSNCKDGSGSTNEREVTAE